MRTGRKGVKKSAGRKEGCKANRERVMKKGGQQKGKKGRKLEKWTESQKKSQ